VLAPGSLRRNRPQAQEKQITRVEQLFVSKQFSLFQDGNANIAHESERVNEAMITDGHNEFYEFAKTDQNWSKTP